VGLFISGKLLAEGNIQSLSAKLFSSSPYVIQVGVGGTNRSETWVQGILKDVEGIVSVREKNNLFEIECSRDITSEIARSIVSAGADLYHLNKKEYGLDEIYDRYFDGGVNHE
jgi:ABC-2 type transport system ATP-binding protein